MRDGFTYFTGVKPASVIALKSASSMRPSFSTTALPNFRAAPSLSSSAFLLSSNVNTDLRPIDICSCDEIEIVSEDVEGYMGHDLTNFARRESRVSHTIEVLIINTASLFDNGFGEVNRLSIFSVVDFSFEGVDDLSVIQPSKLAQKV